MRATASSVTCGAKAGAYCERSVRPAIISPNQRIAHVVRASPLGAAAGVAVSARVIVTGSTASKATRTASPMLPNRTTERWFGFADRVNMLETSPVDGGGRSRPPFGRGPPSAAAALDGRQLAVLDLLSQKRDRIARILEVRDQVGRGAADEAADVRELHDRLVELDHDRRDQRQHPAVVLSRVLAGRRLLHGRRRCAVERHVVFLIRVHRQIVGRADGAEVRVYAEPRIPGGVEILPGDVQPRLFGIAADVGAGAPEGLAIDIDPGPARGVLRLAEDVVAVVDRV